MVGGSNVAFYKQLKAAGLNGENQTLLSMVVSENEIDGIGTENAVGYYACMGYFQSLKNPRTRSSSRPSRPSTAQNRVVGDTMECGYISVYLWKLAAEKAKSFDVRKVVAASSDLPLDAPEGKIHFTPRTTTCGSTLASGRSQPDGQFDMVYESPLIEPNPFPKL